MYAKVFEIPPRYSQTPGACKMSDRAKAVLILIAVTVSIVACALSLFALNAVGGG